ncbi:MGMT family protein [Candidatus Desantisbacteria bacterium]|nr:MGMT family protein [Candidatus Desantisbacteria bacterium]
MLLSYYSFVTIIGKIHIGVTSKGVKFVNIGELNTGNKLSKFKTDSIFFKSRYGKLIDDINEYLSGNCPLKQRYPLDLDGYTPFQLKIWKILTAIPYGETRSYLWVAEKAGNPMAARAVGQANRSNPLPLFIPCHRVIRRDGKLGGFSCGIKYKKLLIELERH